MLPPKKTITSNTLSLPMLLDLLKLRSPETYSGSRQHYASRSQPSATKLPGSPRVDRAWQLLGVCLAFIVQGIVIRRHDQS